MSKKILEITGSLNCAGIETLLVNVLKSIDKKNFKIDFLVVANKEYFYTKEVLNLGSKIYSYPFKNVHKILIPFFFLKELILLLKNKYDVVHCHFYFSAGIVLFIAWLCGVKKRIVHSHNAREIFAPKILKKIFTKIMQKMIDLFATDKIACSKEAGIALYGKNSSFKVINNGIDINKFKYNAEIRNKIRKQLNIENKFVVGHIGRFDKQKNHDFLIDIFNEIYKQEKNAILILLGEGQLQKNIKGKVKNLNLQNSVMFLGNQSNVNEFYQAMDVFVLPSLHEGLPIVGVEAQTSGLPCFFSDTISKDLNIINSYFLPLENSEKYWTNEILKIYANFNRVDVSQKVVDFKYDITNTINKIKQLYE